MRLAQIAASVSDVRRSQRWYREVVGLVPAGGTSTFVGPLASMVQGVPRAASTCWWLVDAQDGFQLELFEFRSPPVRPLPPDWRPSDAGYSTVGFHVGDLDEALARAAATGSAPVGELVGAAGSRRACLRDPDGILVELMEDDPRAAPARERPRGEVGTAARFVTLSVPALEPALRTFGEVLGLDPGDDDAVHGVEHEALWGLAGATCERRCLWADDVAVELVSYSDPPPRPLPPGYRISDLGLLNVAFGFRDRPAFEAALERCREAGLRPNGPVLRLGAWSVVYVNDDQGTSIELLHVEPWFERRMGFAPRRTPRLAPIARGRRDGAAGFRRAAITGAAGGIGREIARLAAAEGTELVLVDRDAKGLEELAAQLGGEGETSTLTADFTDLEAVDRLAAGLAQDDRLDLLVASAGLDRAQSMLGFDWRQAHEDFRVNVVSNLVLLAHLAPAMAARGRGHVTAIISLAGLVGMPFEAAYSASKAALATAIESARAELEPSGVTFTNVYPGFVDTPMFRGNAFRHTYSLAPRDAAERIWAATARRRAALYFPAREHAKLRVGRLLPTRLRDRLTRGAMRFGRDG